MLLLTIMAAVAYTVVLAVATSDSNVKHNRDLFNGVLPPPELFGLHGRVPLSQASAEVTGDHTVYPDLANADGTGPHRDYAWMLHGIPSYLITNKNLSRESLEQNHYKIVQIEGSPDQQYDAVLSVEESTATSLQKRQFGGPPRDDCLTTPPAPQGAASAVCRNQHAALLHDCATLYYLMTSTECRPWDRWERVFGVYRSCALVARRARWARECVSNRDIASYALPIINQCWGTIGRCTDWRSGVIQGNNLTPKICVCNNESIGPC